MGGNISYERLENGTDIPADVRADRLLEIMAHEIPENIKNYLNGKNPIKGVRSDGSISLACFDLQLVGLGVIAEEKKTCVQRFVPAWFIDRDIPEARREALAYCMCGLAEKIGASEYIQTRSLKTADQHELRGFLLWLGEPPTTEMRLSHLRVAVDSSLTAKNK